MIFFSSSLNLYVINKYEKNIYILVKKNMKVGMFIANI